MTKLNAKIAKEWFTANPISKVVYHFRWDKLPAASREMMSAPRVAAVHGNAVLFSPHQSEMSLKGIDAKVTNDGKLNIFTEDGTLIITYVSA